VRSHGNGGGQVDGVRRAQAVPGTKDGRELSRGLVHRAQVQPGQEGGQRSGGVRLAILQRLGQHFGQEKHRADADRRGVLSAGPVGKQRGDPLT
jgi:hypothetical protein